MTDNIGYVLNPLGNWPEAPPNPYRRRPRQGDHNFPLYISRNPSPKYHRNAVRRRTSYIETMNDAIKPRGREAYQCAVKFLEALCELPKPMRTIADAIRRVEQHYHARGQECPASEITMRKWAAQGLDIDGVPEVAKPLLEVAEDVNGGSDALRKMGGGDAVSAALRAKTLDEAVKLAGTVIRADEFKEHVQKRPSDLTALMGKLIEAEKVSGATGDLMDMIEDLTEEQGGKVVHRLLEKFPGILQALLAGLEDESGA